MREEIKNKLAFIEGWISIFINTVLFGLKYWAGVVTGSVAIIADTQGDFWVIHYGYSLPLLLCSPIPFGLPLLITVIITGMLDSKKIYRWIQAKKAASSELPKT
mgnify:CR=1 FL=1